MTLPVVFAAMLAAQVARVASDPGSRVPEPEPLVEYPCPDTAGGLPAETQVGAIELDNEKIFDAEDPGERQRFHRWVNHLHRRTHEEVIRQQLLFHEGDRVSPRVFEESERALRATGFFSEATIRPIRCRGKVVDLAVETHDVWTLDGGVDFGRSGGTNSTSFKISDDNFLGTGKGFALRYSSDVDRSGFEARYLDRSLFGTHGRLELGYAARDDGERWQLAAGRPFFSLDTRWAAGAEALHDERQDRLYRRGEVVDRFEHVEERFDLSTGLSRGLRDDHVQRWSLGLTYSHDTFLPPAAGSTAPGELPEGVLPEDRTLIYPWVGFERITDRFAVARDLDQIGRAEDRRLGSHLFARVGFASPAFGSDRSRLIYDAEWSNAWGTSPERMLELDAGGHGRLGDQLEDLLVFSELRLYRRDFGRHLLFARVRADAANELDRDHQLLLGGDTGLRGYPLRFQDGDRRLLFTVEQRFFTNWYPWHLFRVGGAVFLDYGRAWSSSGIAGPDDPFSGFLGDVGLGLRLGLSHSGKGSVVHIDVAFPWQNDGIDAVQWLISTSKRF